MTDKTKSQEEADALCRRAVEMLNRLKTRAEAELKGKGPAMTELRQNEPLMREIMTKIKKQRTT